jgi:hypothetical protein
MLQPIRFHRSSKECEVVFVMPLVAFHIELLILAKSFEIGIAMPLNDSEAKAIARTGNGTTPNVTNLQIGNVLFQFPCHALIIGECSLVVANKEMDAAIGFITFLVSTLLIINVSVFAHVFLPQHFLYFLPLLQGQGSLRPTLGILFTTVSRMLPKIAFPLFDHHLISSPNSGSVSSKRGGTSFSSKTGGISDNVSMLPI